MILEANFGVILGGVLFALEVCSTYFPVVFIWKKITCEGAELLVFSCWNSSGWNLLQTSLEFYAVSQEVRGDLSGLVRCFQL